MPNEENGTLLKIENAILKSTADLKEHIDERIDKLGEKYDEKIELNRKATEKAWNRVNILWVVLLSTGVISGGVWGVVKMFAGE